MSFILRILGKSSNGLAIAAPSLRYSVSWTFAGNVVYAASQWGILVLLAKLGTPELVGQFTLALAVTAPVFMLLNLQLRVVLATDTNRQYEFGDYLRLRLAAIALSLLLIIGLVSISHYQKETAIVILLIGLAKAVDSVADIFYGLMQQKERMDQIAQSTIVRSIISLIVLGSTIYLTQNLIYAAIALVLSSLLQLVGWDRRSVQSIEKPFFRSSEFEILKLAKLAKTALPLGIVMMLISLNANIPRYFIERHLGQRELGIFSAIAYFQFVGNILVAALGQSASTRLAKYYAAKNYRVFKKIMAKLIASAIILGVSGILVALVSGKEILALVYQPEYAAYSNILVWLMVASGIGYVGNYLGYGVTATRAFHRFTLPYAFVTLLTAITSYLLVPAFGLLGAAWTICIASVANCLAPLFILVKLQKTS